MIAYRTGYRRRTKPPLGSRIDWSHPLATGLVGCFLLNENGGTTVFDLASAQLLPVASGTSWSSGLLSDAAAHGVYTTCPAVFKVGPPISLVWQGHSVGTADGFAYIFGINANNTGSSPFNAALISYNTNASQVTFFCTATGGGTNVEIDFGAMPSGTAQLAVTWGATSNNTNNPISCYKNGILGNQSVETGTPIAYSSTSQIGIGGYPTLNSRLAHDFALIYNRALNPGDVQWLAEEPYALWVHNTSTERKA